MEQPEPLLPQVPLTFRHPWSSSSFSWLTRPGFLQMDGRVWLQGLSFHLPSCRVGKGMAMSPSDSLGNVPVPSPLGPKTFLLYTKSPRMMRQIPPIPTTQMS